MIITASQVQHIPNKSLDHISCCSVVYGLNKTVLHNIMNYAIPITCNYVYHLHILYKKN